MDLKNHTLTTDVVNDSVNVNQSLTNNTQSNQKSARKKRHSNSDASSNNAQDKHESIVQVTPQQLKVQVDDLVENFNKLAKSLNRPQIDEKNEIDLKLPVKKTVSVRACFQS